MKFVPPVGERRLMLDSEQDRELERRLRCHERGLYYTHLEAERSIAQLARPDNLDELLRRAPEFADAIREAAARFRPVRAVGYWKSSFQSRETVEDRFPSPADLVSPGWCEGEGDRIAA